MTFKSIYSLHRSHNIRSQGDFSRRLRWAGHVGRMSTSKILTATNTAKRPSGRPRRRRGDNIRMDLREICTNTRNWVDSAQDRDY